MNFAKEVTVVIPTLNRPEYLKRALESVESQTLQPARVLVVDNASTDETRQIVEQFRTRISNLVYFRHVKKIDAILNWIFSVKKVETRFCKIVWDDDWLEPNCIERLVFLQKKFNADVVLTGAFGHVNQTEYLWYQQEEFNVREWKFVFPKIALRALPNSPLAGLHLTSDVLFALEQFEYSPAAISESLVVGPDLVINFLAAAENRCIVFTPEPLVHMFGDGQNMTGQNEKLLPSLYKDALLRLCEHASMKLTLIDKVLLNRMTTSGFSIQNLFYKILGRLLIKTKRG
jgi:glycosyltransferase involved in cell wall biosynthesis